MKNILNFGCRLNSYEGDLIANNIDDSIIVVNTCTVTNEAERQVRQAIRKAKRENPDKKIIVVGCAVNANRDLFESMPEVDLVLDNKEKLKKENYTKLLSKTPKEVLKEERARAFIKIQNGCNHNCTFCIIPYCRGGSVSTPENEIINNIKWLVENGCNELVLTGVDISDYKSEKAKNLGELCNLILKEVPELPRLRLSSIDAVEVDDTLLNLFGEESRLMPHLHISVQSGDDMVLKRMGRRHLRQDIIDFCEKLREKRPDIVFGADFIAGFPTETEEMFQNTVKLIEEAGLTWLHIFPYSEKANTPAAKMPQIPVNIRKQRAKILREIGKKRATEYIKSWIGKEVPAIIETPKTVRTNHFILFKLDDEYERGSIVNLKIIDEKNAVVL